MSEAAQSADGGSVPLRSSRPRVSIITVCFNSAATIRETIESVLSQDYPEIEYIIIDGLSSDSTMAIVAEYANRISAILSERDGGIYDAMNKGISRATGDVIGILNSDDVYESPEVVGQLIGAMQSANADAVFADLVYVDAVEGARITRYYNSGRWSPARFRYGWMPAHPTYFAKRWLYQAHGLFSLEYKIAADFELLVRQLYCGRASYAYLPRPVVRMREGGLSTKGIRNSWRLNAEIVRACKRNGIWTSLPLLLLKIPAKLLERVWMKGTG